MTPLDSTEEAVDVQLDIQRRLGAAARLELAIQMSEMARDLAEAGYRRRHPDASAAEARSGVAERLYGRVERR